MRPSQPCDSGFTLLEIVVAMVLLSLLAGAAAPFALSQIQGQRIRLTQQRMERVIGGMLGDPSRGGHGYVGDLGELPPTLADLNQRGAKPVYAIDANDGIGTGYNGPYVPQAGAAGVPFMDAWGSSFAYTPGTAQLSSAGADRQFGTGDDLVYPDAAPLAVGNLSVSVVGVPNDSGVSCLLGDDDADVFAASSASGTRTEAQLAGPNGSGGPFNVAGLHKGIHGVRVVGQSDFAGATARDTVEILGSSAALRVTLVQPAGAAVACGGSGGGPGAGGGPGGTPPGQGGTPPGQGGTPPGQGGTPPGLGGTPPGQGGGRPGVGRPLSIRPSGGFSPGRSERRRR